MVAKGPLQELFEKETEIENELKTAQITLGRMLLTKKTCEAEYNNAIKTGDTIKIINAKTKLEAAEAGLQKANEKHEEITTPLLQELQEIRRNIELLKKRTLEKKKRPPEGPRRR